MKVKETNNSTLFCKLWAFIYRSTNIKAIISTLGSQRRRPWCCPRWRKEKRNYRHFLSGIVTTWPIPLINISQLSLANWKTTIPNPRSFSRAMHSDQKRPLLQRSLHVFAGRRPSDSIRSQNYNYHDGDTYTYNICLRAGPSPLQNL